MEEEEVRAAAGSAGGADEIASIINDNQAGVLGGGISSFGRHMHPLCTPRKRVLLRRNM